MSIEYCLAVSFNTSLSLQEEKAHFLPASVGETASHSCADRPFLSLTVLRDKVVPLGALSLLVNACLIIVTCVIPQ